MRIPQRADTAAQRAYRDVRAAIVSGGFEAGEMLSENEIAAALGMSRTPVRLALARLQDDGWLRIYPKRGVQVRELGADDIRQILAARHVIESGSVAVVSESLRSELADRLEEVVIAQAHSLARGDWSRFAELSVAFHREFVVAGDNSFLLDFYDRLHDHQAMILHHSRSDIEERREDLLDEHRALIAAVRAGDSARFDDVLRRHLTATYRTKTDHRDEKVRL